ncbi:YuiB family protein [Lederbergia citrea]|uniref:YuiB family protein n=1 Tax=Lederbergia citrea TaxID=2833581 RepID=A0A942Z4Y5_9BACI|nr:YuiB family protein [Lederbergia citrea]MBS4178566.1 YuiB family protein [Lederbergia citrea]MBS4205254.1 YuiB family protein [Lederbergia citrea]MBS4222885.1 YuiB family protein [Lederbergia citrea]
MQMAIPVLLISMLLFFVLFFGIGFLLNMLLRMTWIMAIIYPVIAILIIDKVNFSEYFTNPGSSFTSLGKSVSRLAAADITILASGLAGAILSGVTMRVLRAKGYRMF